MVRPPVVLDGMGRLTGSGAGRRGRPSQDPTADPAHQARLWAEQTALSQGLPPRVADPTVIRNVAVLLGTGREPDIRFQRGGARDELGRKDDDEGDRSSQSAWWKTVEVWERIGPVELLQSDFGRGLLFGARCDVCGGAAVVGWSRDGGAVAVAAVRHSKQMHGDESTASYLRSPEGVDATGVEGVAASHGRVDGDVVDQSGDDGSLPGRRQAGPLTP